MRLEVLGWYTRRWSWYRPTFSRMGLRTADGRFAQYAQGIAWSYRLGPFVLTRYADCCC